MNVPAGSLEPSTLIVADAGVEAQQEPIELFNQLPPVTVVTAIPNPKFEPVLVTATACPAGLYPPAS